MNCINEWVALGSLILFIFTWFEIGRKANKSQFYGEKSLRESDDRNLNDSINQWKTEVEKLNSKVGHCRLASKFDVDCIENRVRELEYLTRKLKKEDSK